MSRNETSSASRPTPMPPIRLPSMVEGMDALVAVRVPGAGIWL